MKVLLNVNIKPKADKNILDKPNAYYTTDGVSSVNFD